MNQFDHKTKKKLIKHLKTNNMQINIVNCNLMYLTVIMYLN